MTMEASFSVAIIPGDGIGAEVIPAALRVLEAATPEGTLSLHEFPWGSDYYKRTGRMMDDDGVDQLRKFDAILFGACGDPAVPDNITLWHLRLAICQGLDQYVCYRPSRRVAGVPIPLRTEESFDFVIVRENTEGEYSGSGGRTHRGLPIEVATQTAVMTRTGTERIVDYAFELAQRRRQHLTSITKSNAQEFDMGLWDEVVAKRGRAYPEITVRKLLVDAAAARLVLAPHEFDVVVASNLFGDILSDLGGALVGSLGLAASANIDPSGRNPSMFEPVHGSAPDILGRGIANPVGAIASAALMLDNLGLADEAEAVTRAVELALTAGARTPDIGGSCTTEEVTQEIVGRLKDPVTA